MKPQKLSIYYATNKVSIDGNMQKIRKRIDQKCY